MPSARKALSAVASEANKLSRIDAFKQYDDDQKERPVIGKILESKPDY